MKTATNATTGDGDDGRRCGHGNGREQLAPG
jgi:hypothetical protein